MDTHFKLNYFLDKAHIKVDKINIIFNTTFIEWLLFQKVKIIDLVLVLD